MSIINIRRSGKLFKIAGLLMPSLMMASLNVVAQNAAAPVLGLDDAVSQAIEHNAALQTASLESRRVAAELAASRTKRYASSSVSAQGAQLLTHPYLTFAAGSLGTYAATGPIPARDQKISIPRDFVGIVTASVNQPLSNLYKIHLQLKSLTFGLQSTREDERSQRLETIDKVRRAYYDVVQVQSQLDSLTASLPYYQETERVAAESKKRETLLESALLQSTQQLLETQNAVNEANDNLDTACEKLNDLMGRDIHTRFRVSSVPDGVADGETQAELEGRALQNRPDVKKVRLDVVKADYDRRAKWAEYIPEISGEVSYYSTYNFGNTLPSNIAIAGVSLNWEPWDWGRKHQEVIGKRAQEDQAKVSESSTERAALIEVNSTWRRLQEAQRKIALSEANLRTMRQRLQEIQEQAKREEKLTKDLFAAQADLASADYQHEQALTAFWKARADLKKATGEE